MNRTSLTYCQATPDATHSGTFAGFVSMDEEKASGFLDSKAQRKSLFSGFVFTGKERDQETGYGYFGARYYDANLLTGFVSVDRFSDKYPSISPYNYCLWNPTILLDPSGDSVVVKGNEADKYMKNIQSLHLRVERNAKSGVLSASIKGRYNKCDLSDYERQLYDAIGSASCRIEITASKTERRNTQNVFLWEDGTEYSTNLGGSNMGTEYDNTTNTAVARAFVDPDLLANNGFEQGEAHEAIEGYICASIAINEKKDIPLAKQVPGKSGTNSDIEKACRQSVSAMVHPGDIYQFGTKSGRIK